MTITQIKLILALLALPLFLSAQHVFHISPQGNDDWNGLYPEHQGGNNGPWETFEKANAELKAGDAVEILAGMYEAQIRPQNSGFDNENRIIYRPYGDGDVIFPICFYNGTNHEEGIIALGNLDYITVTGRSLNGDESERLFKIEATGICTHYGNMAGSEGCIVENISMDHIGTEYAPNRGFVIADYWWTGLYESKYCVLRNCIIKGYVRDRSLPTKYTEDVISIAKNAHHILIENNEIGECDHVSLNLNQATTHSIVIRNNTIANPLHTALSFYGLNENPPIQHSHLIEGNTITASANNDNVSSPGNALQYGASESILRHNIIAEGGHVTAPSSVGGLSCYMGDNIKDMSDNRFYNNTIAHNEPSAVGSYFFGGAGLDKGRNKWVNNIIYGSSSLLVRYWDDFDDGYDRYYSNLFGNPTGSPQEKIINIGLGQVTLAQAKANYSNPNQPDFSDWNGFENVYHIDPNFENYGSDYSINSMGPCYDAGAPLTIVDSADLGTGVNLMVEDSRFFYSEASEFPDWMGINEDWIAIGPNIQDAQFVQIENVIDSLNTIVLASDIQRNPSDFIWLWKNSGGMPVVKGDAPDIGASENGVVISYISTPNISNLKLYPNPTSGSFQMSQKATLEWTSEAYLLDVNGTQLKRFNLQNAELSIAEFPNGLYFLKVRVDGNYKFFKIILLK